MPAGVSFRDNTLVATLRVFSKLEPSECALFLENYFDLGARRLSSSLELCVRMIFQFFFFPLLKVIFRTRVLGARAFRAI